MVAVIPDVAVGVLILTTSLALTRVALFNTVVVFLWCSTFVFTVGSLGAFHLILELLALGKVPVLVGTYLELQVRGSLVKEYRVADVVTQAPLVDYHTLTVLGALFLWKWLAKNAIKPFHI